MLSLSGPKALLFLQLLIVLLTRFVVNVEDFLFVALVTNRVSLEEVCLPSFDVLLSGEDVCCSVVFGTLVGVSVFSIIWSELLLTSAISCPLWSSVYDCQRVECAFTSPVKSECDMFMLCSMHCCISVATVL